jgi:hypothetical protein
MCLWIFESHSFNWCHQLEREFGHNVELMWLLWRFAPDLKESIISEKIMEKLTIMPALNLLAFVLR